MSKSDLLFLLTLASLPVQLSKFIFPEYSYVLGLPIDYRAVSIYLSDIFIILYLIVFLFENSKNLGQIYHRQKHFITSLAALNLYLFASSALLSISKEASFVFNLKILMMSLLAVAAAHTLSKKKITKPAAQVLKFSLVWQATLVFLQFMLQRSLNLWVIGERSFDASTPGIAHTQFFSRFIMRPYGTFPHPNVLAAYLSLGIIILAAFLSLRSRAEQGRSNLPNVVLIALPTLALILTYSRSAAATIAIAIFVATKKLEYFIIEAFFVFIIGALILKHLLASQLSSVAERLLLIQSALDIALINPLFGIGSNNFILELSKLDLTSLAETRLLQPVHNVFLLILTENGVIGLILFTAVLLAVAKSITTKTKAILFVSILIYATVDHFLWTLHQGQMMLFLTLAYIACHQKKKPTI